MAICIAIKMAVIMAIETAQPEASDEYSLALRFAASGDLCQTIHSVGSEIGSLLADFQDSVRRRSTTVESTIDASKVMDRGNKDHAIDKRRRTSTTDALSPREIATIELIGRGQSNKEDARTLGITPETVKSHVKHIFLKLEVETRAQAVLRARALGLTSGVGQTSRSLGKQRRASAGRRSMRRAHRHCSLAETVAKHRQVAGVLPLQSVGRKLRPWQAVYDCALALER